MTKIFHQNDVVWAKIKGFPWWPGVIGQIGRARDGSIEYLVNFLGDWSYSKLPENKLSNFENKFKEYANRKNRKQNEAIKIAQKIIEGETNFEVEQRKMEKRAEMSRASSNIPITHISDPKPITNTQKPQVAHQETQNPLSNSNISNLKENSRVKRKKDHTSRKSYIRRSSRSSRKMDRGSRMRDSLDSHKEAIINPIKPHTKSKTPSEVTNRKKFYEIEIFYQNILDEMLEDKARKAASLGRLIIKLNKILMEGMELPKISENELLQSKLGKYVMGIKLYLEKLSNKSDYNDLENVLKMLQNFVKKIGERIISAYFDYDALVQTQKQQQQEKEKQIIVDKNSNFSQLTTSNNIDDKPNDENPNNVKLSNNKQDHTNHKNKSTEKGYTRSGRELNIFSNIADNNSKMNLEYENNDENLLAVGGGDIGNSSHNKDASKKVIGNSENVSGTGEFNIIKEVRTRKGRKKAERDKQQRSLSSSLERGSPARFGNDDNNQYMKEHNIINSSHISQQNSVVNNNKKMTDNNNNNNNKFDNSSLNDELLSISNKINNKNSKGNLLDNFNGEHTNVNMNIIGDIEEKMPPVALTGDQLRLPLESQQMDTNILSSTHSNITTLIGQNSAGGNNGIKEDNNTLTTTAATKSPSQLKMDENSENEIMKKRVCKKLAKELIKHYHISKKDAEYVAMC